LKDAASELALIEQSRKDIDDSIVDLAAARRTLAAMSRVIEESRTLLKQFHQAKGSSSGIVVAAHR
jgi:hypothetical protein